MFGSMILETAIGLTLIYLMLSLVCTALNELISQMLRMRANNLAEGIRNILADPAAEGCVPGCTPVAEAGAVVVCCGRFERESPSTETRTR